MFKGKEGLARCFETKMDEIAQNLKKIKDEKKFRENDSFELKRTERANTHILKYRKIKRDPLDS